MSGLAGCGLFRATMRAVEFCTTTRAPRGTAQLSIFRRVDVRVVACAKAGPENRTRRRGMSLMTRDIPDPIHATTNPVESCAPGHPALLSHRRRILHMHGQARLPELSALGYFRQRSRHARDPLSFSEVSLTASSRMPPLRGKGDSPV